MAPSWTTGLQQALDVPCPTVLQPSLANTHWRKSQDPPMRSGSLQVQKLSQSSRLLSSPS